MSTFTPRRAMMAGHYMEAVEDLKTVVELVGGRKVTKVKLVSDSCAESYPCSGHDGVRITFSDGTFIVHDCSSVSSGAIMVYYNSVSGAKVSDHCTGYIESEFKDHLIRQFHCGDIQ